jgi:hypothetical protein
VNSLFCACYYAIVNRFFFCYSASDVACLIAACVPASVIAACVPASSTPSCICQIFSHLKTGVVRSTARAIGSQISGGWFVLNLWFFFWHAQQSYHALPLPALLRSSPLTGLRLLLRRTNSSASHPPLALSQLSSPAAQRGYTTAVSPATTVGSACHPNPHSEAEGHGGGRGSGENRRC